MIELRQVKQTITKGKIYLHSMPGIYENLDELTKKLKELKLSKIICLITKSEIKVESLTYLKAVINCQLDNIPIIYNPVPDFGIPVGKKALAEYHTTLRKAYEELKTRNILIHCFAGIGRTGTFSVILLRMIGYSFEEAYNIVLSSGSRPQTSEQMDFCREYKV